MLSLFRNLKKFSYSLQFQSLKLTIERSPSSRGHSLDDRCIHSKNFSFRSSLAAPDYDVPRSRLPASSLPSRHNTPVPKTPTPPPPSQTQQIYDVPVSKELPLELDSALEGLQRLQTEASAAIARLLGFFGPGWRTPQRLDATLMDLRLAALRLRTSLHDLAEFAEGNYTVPLQTFLTFFFNN